MHGPEQSSSCTNRPYSTSRSGRRILLCGALGSMVLGAATARADFEVSPGFPTINPQVGMYGVGYSYNSYAEADGFSTVGTDSHSNSMTANPAAGSGLLSTGTISSLATAAVNPAYGNKVDLATNQLLGNVGNGGTMEGFAQSEVDIGYGMSRADVTLTFIDEMQVTTTGIPHFSLSLNGSLNGTEINSNEFAEGVVTARMYVFPVSGGIPAAGQTLNATYFEEHLITQTGDSVSTTGNSNQTFFAGSDWYVAGTLEVQDTANVQVPTIFSAGDSGLDFISTADYAHTVVVHIDPNPGTPNFAYTMASGADYNTPTPEPASAALLGFIIAPLLHRRRR